MSGRALDLILKFEQEGLDTVEEAFELADIVLETGLHRSQGMYGRFLEAAYDAGWRPS